MAKRLRDVKMLLSIDRRDLIDSILILMLMDIDDDQRRGRKMLIEALLMQHTVWRYRAKPVSQRLAFEVMFRWFFEDTDGMQVALEILSDKGYHFREDVSQETVGERLKTVMRYYAAIVASGRLDQQDFDALIALIENP